MAQEHISRALCACKAEIREVLHKIYDEAGDDPPNVNKAWDILKHKMPHARRSRAREVLREEEIAHQRREPGKRRPRLK